MVRLALAREGQISLLCDAEVKAGEYRGTLRLLDRLEKDYPEESFAGWSSDSYPMIPFWRDDRGVETKWRGAVAALSYRYGLGLERDAR